MTKQAMKEALKEALAETLQEHRELLHDVFVDALEDVAFAEAIREGRETKIASRSEIMRMLPDKP
jgi:hypothetical protein